MRGQQSGLKRKNAEHMVHAALDFFDAVCPPRPDGRADEVNRLDALGLECRLQIEVEVRRVDTNEDVGPRPGSAEKPFLQLLTDGGNLTVMPQDLDISAHGKLFARPPGLETAALHLLSADTARPHSWPALVQAVKQQACEQVAGSFASDHGNVGSRLSTKRQ